MTDAAGANAIVWALGTNRLVAYDGESGQEIFDGGGDAGAMTTMQYFQTPIIAKGRVYVAAFVDRVYAFTP